MRYLRYVPFFLILVVLYHIGLGLHYVGTIPANPFDVNMSLLEVPVPSRDVGFVLNISELFAMLGIICLYFEAIKATRTTRDTMIDHMLSMGVFVFCLVEFLVLPGAGTSTFMILTLLTFVDVLLGFTVSYASARRDIAIGGAA